MYYPKSRELRAAVTRRPDLTLLPAPAAGAGVAEVAAQARVRHALTRSVEETLDRAGFTQADGPLPAALAAHLERTCWPTRTGLAGQIASAGADGVALIDLLERGLLLALHGTLNRAEADLALLGVDLDRLKYLRLPLRRVRHDDPAAAAWSAAPLALLGAGEIGILTAVGEPALWLRYAPDARDTDPDAPAPALLEARLLLPGVGLVATAGADGRFRFDLHALARFLCLAEVAVLAQP